MYIRDSSLNIIFIQSSTRHRCFFVTHCSLFFFCPGFSVVFTCFFSVYKSNFIQPISSSSIVATDSSFGSYIVFILSCIFYFHVLHYIQFSRSFDISRLLVCPRVLLLLLFNFVYTFSKFYTQLTGSKQHFCHNPCRISFSKLLYNLIHCVY